MAKKTFSNPTQATVRKGINILIGDVPEVDNDRVEEIYVTSNVRVRKDYREKIYTLKGRTGKTITEIYNMIFDEYFNNNPV